MIQSIHRFIHKTMIKRISITALIITLISIVAIISFIVIRDPLQKKEEPKAPAVRIGISLDTLKEERWKLDKDLIESRIRELGGFPVTFVANGDNQVQSEQIENLITQKVDAIIVVPYNSKGLSQAIDKARNKGIKVIAYDRLIEDTNIDLYISFDSNKVGMLQAEGVISRIKGKNLVYIGGSPTDHNSTLLKEGAMKVIQPKIDSGEIDIIFESFTEKWNPDEAYRMVKELLISGKKIDGLVAANDGTAYGSIRALSEFGLAGKVPVSGQDADLAACQRIVSGTQSVTVYKPIKSLAYKAAELAINLSNNKDTPSNAFTNNGIMSVPSIFIDSILVDKSNINETVIKDGYHSEEDVYK